MNSYQKRKQELKNLQDKYIKLSRKIENLIRLEMIGGDETLINNLREKIIEELGLENSINNSLLVRGWNNMTDYREEVKKDVLDYLKGIDLLKFDTLEDLREELSDILLIIYTCKIYYLSKGIDTAIEEIKSDFYKAHKQQ